LATIVDAYFEGAFFSPSAFFNCQMSLSRSSTVAEKELPDRFKHPGSIAH
jgi:hypothetical protein